MLNLCDITMKHVNVIKNKRSIDMTDKLESE